MEAMHCNEPVAVIHSHFGHYAFDSPIPQIRTTEHRKRPHTISISLKRKRKVKLVKFANYLYVIFNVV